LIDTSLKSQEAIDSHLLRSYH